MFWKRASVSTFPFEDSRNIGKGGFLVFWKRASVSTFPFEDSREIGKGDAEITKRSTLDVRSKRGSHLKVLYIRDSQVKGGFSRQGSVWIAEGTA